MAIRGAKVSLDGIDLQVDTNGVHPHKATIVDDLRPWLGREKLASLRGEDDSLGFETVVLSGKRIRVHYGAAQAVPVPVNNNAALDKLYSKVMQFGYDLQGTGMSAADSLHFRQQYHAAQLIWAQRSKLLSQLSDPDVTKAKRDLLVIAFNAIVFPTMQLNIHGATYSVFFAEGASCSFTDWVITDHNDFQFSLISRQPV